LYALKLLNWIVVVGADIGSESVGFLAYRLERASEPKAHELPEFKEGVLRCVCSFEAFG
jgi:hypothetical protein